MDHQRHQRMRSLFDRALERPASERHAFLERECQADAEMLAEVEAMLAAADDSKFLSAPTGRAGDSSQADAFSEKPGDVIGPYELVEVIGEGGFGVVWNAQQETPIRRRVALKILKIGMDTKEVVMRFEQERQALALMDHPNISRVLDAGATSTGRPYFVMELVLGVPILQYCDDKRLDTRARLALFIDVCRAVQHAHQKGIIHRDIKPSNVMVTEREERPVPKVIDFGIAKAIDLELTTRTLFTERFQIIGTPAYMSPEQADRSGQDIDTRSDVYGLGALLYELLTGTTPFDVHQLMTRGYEEWLRAIREDDPQKPSTRILALGEGAESTALEHNTDIRRLQTTLRGDLDWIVMRCLEKDRARRYESASGLALDIDRYLKGETVLAAPPSAGYRLKKTIRRHRAAFATSAVFLASLILGLIGTLWQARVAAKQRDIAGL